MSTGSILVSIGACVTFLLFAFVIAWADHSVTHWQRNNATAKQPPDAAELPDRKIV